MKKISLFYLCFLLLIFSHTIYSVQPKWTNTNMVTLYHENIDGDAHCEVVIQGLVGTTRIDNVDIKLYVSYQGSLFSVEAWEDLYVNGSQFEFYDIVENIEPGLKYRLKVTADVHRNGTVESIESHLDVEY